MDERSIKNSVVLVTGGAGFIGSHMVERLALLGAKKIIALDNLKYGSRESLLTDEKIEFIEFNLGIDNSDGLNSILDGVDFVFHLAAEKHNQSKDSPHVVFDSNTKGTYDLYKAAAQARVKKIIFSSSLYAYGRRSGDKYIEDELPQPDTIYGISKLDGENLLRYAHREWGVDFTVLRYLFVYGPKQFAGTGYKSVIVKNFERIADNKSPVVYGDGEQILDYIYIDDVIDLTMASLAKKCDSEVINVCSGEATSVNKLTDTMIKVSGKNLAIEKGPADWTHGTYRVGDSRKMIVKLGLEPKVNLQTGLKKTYDWIKKDK